MITRPQTAALVARDRLNLAPGAYMPPANHWLRMWLGFFQYLACYRDCDGGVEETQNSVGATPVVLLAANHLSQAITITNNGVDASANIYEGGVLMAVVQPGESKPLPMKGLLEVTAVTPANSAQITATRYLRCACGDTFSYSGYGDEPVGAFLL